MIKDVDEALAAWAETVLGDVDVNLGPPPTVWETSGASFYLLEIVDAPPLRSRRRAPYQVALRYLVTTGGPTPEEAHALLGQLLFAGLQHPDYDVELEPLTGSTWLALDTRPQPSFVLRVELRLERPEPEAKPVLEELRVEETTLTRCHGVVLTKDDVPVAGATIELPLFGRAARTDQRGRFAFAAIPAQPESVEVRVRARGYERDFDVKRGSADEPIVLRFDPFDT